MKNFFKPQENENIEPHISPNQFDVEITRDFAFIKDSNVLCTIDVMDATIQTTLKLYLCEINLAKLVSKYSPTPYVFMIGVNDNPQRSISRKMSKDVLIVQPDKQNEILAKIKDSIS